MPALMRQLGEADEPGLQVRPISHQGLESSFGLREAAKRHQSIRPSGPPARSGGGAGRALIDFSQHPSAVAQSPR